MTTKSLFSYRDGIALLQQFGVGRYPWARRGFVALVSGRLPLWGVGFRLSGGRRQRQQRLVVVGAQGGQPLPRAVGRCMRLLSTLWPRHRPAERTGLQRFLIRGRVGKDRTGRRRILTWCARPL